MDDLQIESIYQLLITETDRITESHNCRGILREQIFNLILVLNETRSGMLFEVYESDSERLKIIKEEIVQMIKKIIRSNLPEQRPLNHIKIKKCYGSHYLIYCDKYQEIVNQVEDDDVLMGKILDFVCPGGHQNQMDDRMVQTIYVQEEDFIVQVCPWKDYELNHAKFDDQLKRYQKVGESLNLSVRADYRKDTGIHKLMLMVLDNDFVRGIIEHKDIFINHLRQDSEDWSQTIDSLNQSYDHMIKNEQIIRSILMHCLIKNSNQPISKIERFLYNDLTIVQKKQ
jgi:hypothetical protein